MRTDPRAEEVRAIVERVFATLLESGRRRPQPVYARAGQAKFPRLYEPADAPLEEYEDFDAPCDDQADDEPWGPSDHRSRFSPRLAVRTLQSDRLEIDETVLVDEGRYVARSYRIEGYMAMWLVAVGIVQFYDDRGRMLATINLFETLRPKRMAA